ncbi:UDP-N-acetylmuramoyl-tripeptide--D-alanyl-D-alanine ligase [Oceanithermus sp.]
MTPPRYLNPELVAAIVGGSAGSETEPASDAVWDSRMVEPQAAFIALAGKRLDGEQFVGEALQKGAAFAISRQQLPKTIRVSDTREALLKLGSWLRGGLNGPLVAVTGSVGKTSTKEALSSGLAWPATAGNLNTPPALLRFFWNLEPSSPGAVVELGIDRPGEMDELVHLTAPDLGILTAIAPVHLEGLGSLEAVAREKLRLLEASPLRLAHAGTASWGLPSGTLTYGFQLGAHFFGDDLRIDCRGTSFRFGKYSLRLKALGKGAALAALAALAAAEMLGQSVAAVVERLQDLGPAQHRLEIRRANGQIWLDDTYNASPAALEAALEVLASCPGRKGVVLGTMRELGEEAERWHLWATERIREVAEGALFVGEFAERMAADWPEATALNSTEEAASLLPEWSRRYDAVLVKGSRALGLEKLLEVVGV